MSVQWAWVRRKEGRKEGKPRSSSTITTTTTTVFTTTQHNTTWIHATTKLMTRLITTSFDGHCKVPSVQVQTISCLLDWHTYRHRETRMSVHNCSTLWVACLSQRISTSERVAETLFKRSNTHYALCLRVLFGEMIFFWYNRVLLSCGDYDRKLNQTS